jgi:hypothetical protein
VDLNVPQLMMLRSLRKRGWEAALIPWLPTRCGASPADWEALAAGGLVEERQGRFVLTPEGRRQYRQQSKGKHF